jgi:hypothetical protein
MVVSTLTSASCTPIDANRLTDACRQRYIKRIALALVNPDAATSINLSTYPPDEIEEAIAMLLAAGLVITYD